MCICSQASALQLHHNCDYKTLTFLLSTILATYACTQSITRHTDLVSIMNITKCEPYRVILNQCLVCLMACLLCIRPTSIRSMAPEVLCNKGNHMQFSKLLIVWRLLIHAWLYYAIQVFVFDSIFEEGEQPSLDSRPI